MVSHAAPSPSATPSTALPRVSADYVHIVGQTIGDLPALRSDVAESLAEDAEFYLRELIHRAKAYMRHAKRRTLSTADVALAEREQGGAATGAGTMTGGGGGSGNGSGSGAGATLALSMTSAAPAQPVPGFTSRRPLNFSKVHDSDGLFLTDDPIVPLVDIITEQLPPEPPQVAVTSAWRFLRGGDGVVILDDGPESTLEPEDVIIPKQVTPSLQPLASAVTACLSSRGSTRATVSLDLTLRRLTRARAVPYQRVSHAVRLAVHRHARPEGNELVLHAAMRVARALAARREVQLGAWTDALLPAVLTCVAGRAIRARAVRERAVAALADIARVEGVGRLTRARATATLTALVVDPAAGLGVLAGAVAGLAVLGRDMFEAVIMTNVGALLGTLRNAVQEARKVQGAAGLRVEDEVNALCCAIERGARLSGVVDDEIDEIDVVL